MRADRLGPILSRVRLHAIEERDGGRAIAKRRRWFAAGLIGPGNLYLRWLGAGVLVLPDRDWIARECAVNRMLHGVGCEVDGRGWLILPRWPGLPLSDYGADASRPAGDRLAAVRAAGLALRDLHRLDEPGPPGRPRRLAHGDATTRNVLFDAATGRARWFDFDTAHVPELPDSARHADDLRAFLFSCVEALPDVPVPEVFTAVFAAYDDPGPWRDLRLALAGGTLHASAFHYAQAAIPPERCCQLEDLIRLVG